MNIRHLKTLITVSEKGSFAAGEAVFLTQSVADSLVGGDAVSRFSGDQCVGFSTVIRLDGTRGAIGLRDTVAGCDDQAVRYLDVRDSR